MTFLVAHMRHVDGSKRIIAHDLDLAARRRARERPAREKCGKRALETPQIK
jgi:hypothetical protein